MFENNLNEQKQPISQIISFEMQLTNFKWNHFVLSY